MTKAYAVLDDKGDVLVRTVTDTVRGAKVNWLGTIGGLRVTNDWSDPIIADAFERLRGKATIVEIEISVRKHA